VRFVVIQKCKGITEDYFEVEACEPPQKPLFKRKRGI